MSNFFAPITLAAARWSSSVRLDSRHARASWLTVTARSPRIAAAIAISAICPLRFLLFGLRSCDARFAQVPNRGLERRNSRSRRNRAMNTEHPVPLYRSRRSLSRARADGRIGVAAGSMALARKIRAESARGPGRICRSVRARRRRPHICYRSNYFCDRATAANAQAARSNADRDLIGVGTN